MNTKSYKYFFFFIFLTIVATVFYKSPQTEENTSTSITTDPNFVIYVIAFIVIVFIIRILYLKSFSEKRLIKLFQTAPLEKILSFFGKIFKNLAIQDSDILLSYTKSKVMSLYGEFERAEKEINRYDVSQKQPIYQAGRLNALITANYLQKKDLSYSLELAEKAQILAYQPSGSVSKEMIDLEYATYVEIGRVLNGDLSNETIHKLAKTFEKSHFLLKIKVAWVLTIAYLKLNEGEKAKKMENYLKENAPNCKPLFNFE